MAEDVGFVTMAGPKATGTAPEIGVGMLGYAFMGKAHSNGLKKLPYMMYPPVAIPKLVAIAGRNKEAVTEAASRYGYQKAYTNWQDLIDDPEVQIVDNVGPNNIHLAPNLAAIKAGKHLISEKPLGRNAAECYEMWQAAKKAKIKHMVAFNYRFVPAIRLVKDILDSGKYEEVKRLLDEIIEEGAKVLIFSQFVGMLQIMKQDFTKEKIRFQYLDGSTTPKERQRAVETFQNTPEERVFLISLKAGGTGLNLTAADYVFIIDPWWNPAVEMQAIDRAHRIGQTKTVFYYKFITQNSIEEKILKLQQSKFQLSEDLLSEDTTFLQQLGEEELTWILS